MTTLKQAREQGKLAEFLRERRDDPTGDPDAFNRALQSMAGTSKEAPEASSPAAPDD
jgi:hypothetical protein